jgi:pimeloyl-ACP methyl ester carboxylesterase
VRRLPNFYGWLAKRLSKEVSAGWVRPGAGSAKIRHDAKRFLVTADPKATLDAAERLHTFDRPVLLAWAVEDRFFPLEHARRLAELFPDARVEEIEDSYTYVPEDQPERLAALIGEFAAPERKPAEEKSPAA